MKMNTRIVEREMKRYLGLCKKSGLILIDPRQPPKEFLDTLVHELLHRYFPQLSETAVSNTANDMAEDLWAMNYRRVSQ